MKTIKKLPPLLFKAFKCCVPTLMTMAMIVFVTIRPDSVPLTEIPHEFKQMFEDVLYHLTVPIVLSLVSSKAYSKVLRLTFLNLYYTSSLLHLV